MQNRKLQSKIFQWDYICSDTILRVASLQSKENGDEKEKEDCSRSLLDWIIKKEHNAVLYTIIQTPCTKARNTTRQKNKGRKRGQKV